MTLAISQAYSRIKNEWREELTQGQRDLARTVAGAAVGMIIGNGIHGLLSSRGRVWTMGVILARMSLVTLVALTVIGIFVKVVANREMKNKKMLTLTIQNLSVSPDLSQYPALEWVHLGNNQLTQVDVRGNKELSKLYLGRNQLTELDVSKNKKLKVLSIVSNQFTVFPPSILCLPRSCKVYAFGNPFTPENIQQIQVDLEQVRRDSGNQRGPEIYFEPRDLVEENLRT